MSKRQFQYFLQIHVTFNALSIHPLSERLFENPLTRHFYWQFKEEIPNRATTTSSSREIYSCIPCLCLWLENYWYTHKFTHKRKLLDSECSAFPALIPRTFLCEVTLIFLFMILHINMLRTYESHAWWAYVVPHVEYFFFADWIEFLFIDR